MPICYHCKVLLPEEIGRTTLCGSCGKEVRVCYNCRFYAPGLQWDCRERIDEPVREKDRANFCGFFSPGENRKTGTEGSGTTGLGSGPGRENAAKNAFLGLFSSDDDS